MLIYGKEATTQIENSVPYYSVSKWSSNTKMLLLHFHAPYIISLNLLDLYYG